MEQYLIFQCKQSDKELIIDTSNSDPVPILGNQEGFKVKLRNLCVKSSKYPSYDPRFKNYVSILDKCRL